MNLLIVDDEWYAVKGLSEGVDWADSGIGQVFTAFSVPAAKELVQSNEVNVVLLDIEMPGQNGLLLARWLQETHPNIKILFLTGHANFDYAKEALRAQGLRLHHEAGGPPAAQGPGFGGRAGGAVGAGTGGFRGPLEGPHRQDAGLSSRTNARLLAQCAGQRPQPGADRQLVDRPRGAAAGARLGAARGPLGGRVRGRRHPPGRGPGQLRALRPAQPGAATALWRLSSQGPGSGKPAAPLHLAGGCGAQAAPSLRGPVRPSCAVASPSESAKARARKPCGGAFAA